VLMLTAMIRFLPLCGVCGNFHIDSRTALHMRTCNCIREDKHLYNLRLCSLFHLMTSICCLCYSHYYGLCYLMLQLFDWKTLFAKWETREKYVKKKSVALVRERTIPT
jgi:hypothetical protein